MNTTQIRRAVMSDKSMGKNFRGVFANDVLNLKANVKVGVSNYYICNTAPHYHPGQHWVAIFIDETGTFAEFFCSYGQVPSDEVKIFLKKHVHYCNTNNMQIQYPLSSVCGQYCIYYLYHRSRGMDLKDIIYMLDNDRDSDRTVNNFVKTMSKDLSHLEEFDEDFLLNQIAMSMNNVVK